MSNEPRENPKAITSWSGYVYQGKIALLVLLKMLLDDKEGAIDNFLAIEEYDDFSILSSEEDLISLHQVKCWKSDLFSSYETVVGALEEKLSEGIEGFLHVSKPLRNVNIQGDVKIYSHNDNEFVGLGEINKYIFELSANCFRSINGEEIESDEAKEFLGFKLLAIIENIVQTAHKQNQEENIPLEEIDRRLSFREIFECIESYDPSSFNKKDYIVERVKDRLVMLVRCYLAEDDFEDHTKIDFLEKLSDTVKNLEIEDLIKFLKILKPSVQYEGDEVTTKTLALIPDQESLENPYLDFINYAVNHGVSLNRPRCRAETPLGNELIIPTTMSDIKGNKRRFSERLFRNLTTDPALSELFYDGDVLVSRNIDIEKFFEHVKINENLIFPYEGEGENFNEPRNISIISYSKALSLLGIEDE